MAPLAYPLDPRIKSEDDRRRANAKVLIL